MRSFLPHLSHVARRGSQFVFHRTDLHLLVQRSLSHQILLVDLTDGLSPQKSANLWPIFPLLPIDIKIFSLDLMILICLLLTLKGVSLLVYLPLSKHAGLYKYLFLSRIYIHLHSIVSLPLILTVILLPIGVGGI